MHVWQRVTAYAWIFFVYSCVLRERDGEIEDLIPPSLKGLSLISSCLRRGIWARAYLRSSASSSPKLFPLIIKKKNHERIKFENAQYWIFSSKMIKRFPHLYDTKTIHCRYLRFRTQRDFKTPFDGGDDDDKGEKQVDPLPMLESHPAIWKHTLINDAYNHYNHDKI